MTEYKTARPWIRLILGVIIDLRYRTEVDDWSIKQSYILADEHLTEFEQFPGSIDRTEVNDARRDSKR